MRGHSSMTVLDPQTFAASTLADSGGLAIALRILESCLAGSDNPLDLIMQDLCSVPNLFEFVASVLPSGRKLASRVIDTFPTNPALLETSYTSTLLRRLSSVLFALPPECFSAFTARQIRQYKVYVENALPVLTSLCPTELSTSIFANVPLNHSEYENEEFSRFSIPQKIQKKSKGGDKDSAPPIDPMPFQKLGIEIPSNRAEASAKAHEISNDLKMILKFCFELLFEPSLAKLLKDAYVSTINGANMDPAVTSKANDIEVVGSKQSTLYFANAGGFGDWRIIISTNATKRLRELASVDRQKCAIIVKKIKQLSKGHFSDENQKRLNGPSGVPIFEAKIQQDLRLVYQVDVVPDHGGDFERQVIKIYGIRTHAQFNRIWDAIGRHLAGKGKEYHRRCAFRNRPVSPGGDVYLPAYFPLESVEDHTKVASLVLSDEEMGELHTLLVLDKYITFSQAFLHSLIMNEDVQHVFELTPQERKIVECETSCYVLGRSGTGKTTTMLFKMLGIERAWQMQMSSSDIPKPRQIFVTKSHVLAEKVEEYFTKLLESLALANHSLEDLKARGADASRPRVRVPTKYSLLEGDHFPLFMTFDKLARMIAADVLSGDDPEVQRDAKIFVNTDEIEAEDSFVTYDVFSRTYWPHFPHPLPKGLEPWLVFSEFMGVIKGSERSLTCPGGFLDEKTYCGLPARSNPTFANNRQTLYALFQTYCKLKKKHRHHDAADRTHAILKALFGGTPLGGQRVDYLYVDEAQDNLLIDALLLRLICRNPEGLFYAGDTAQTISAGSSFRFDDLKAFLYRIERDHSMRVIQDRSVVRPSAFHLAINYRSHGGIVNCACTVIERIMHFWPDAIDRLKPEYGVVDGRKPVFFHGWEQDTVQYEQFLFGKSENRIEFGAKQCILVRDEMALDKLRQDIGDEVGLIMTLYDSKGLEFDDVLLYNFFKDSAVDLSRWSVLLNDTEGKVDGIDIAEVYAPSFKRDEGRFTAVCSELKMLYVAITRARKNLWIFDVSKKSEPMRMIWTSRNQVENCTPGMGVPHLAASSTDAEWESSGRDLLKHEKYLQAMRCFAKVPLPRMAAICQAFHLRDLARAKVGVEPRKAQQEAFLAAANAILTATDAFTTSGNDAPSVKDKLQFYRNAAECYARCGDNQKAANVYLSVEEYELAARCFRKAELFDETLEILHVHSQKISADCAEELQTMCRLFYCSKRGHKRPRWPLFSTFEEEERFLKDYDLEFSRVELLEFYRKYLEAAELHLSENRPVDAIRDFLKEQGSRNFATQRATKILLENLWQRCSFAVASKEIATDQLVAQLLDLACELPVSLVDSWDHHEISMFQAIAQADFSTLDKVALTFTNGNRDAPALLALDHFFRCSPGFVSHSDLHEMSDFLLKFKNYACLLRSFILYADPLSTDSIRRLFCIRKESTTKYGLATGSFLHSSATGDRSDRFHSKKSIVGLCKDDMVSVLRKYLGEYLRERVLKANELCCKASVFSQCPFIVANQSNRPQEPVVLNEMDDKQYNLRLVVHLQQIDILQLMFSMNPLPLLGNRAIALDWLSRLCEAVNPQSHVQGPIAISDPSLIPESHDDIHIVKCWVRDALYNLRQDFLTTVLRLTSLFFTFDKSCAIGCIEKAYHNLPATGLPQLIHPDDKDVAEDTVEYFNGTHHICVPAILKFLRRVVKSSRVMHLSVFCNCLEEVIGKISVWWQLFDFPPLDGLVLPRSWLFLNKEFSRRTEISIALIESILDCVRDLLVRLQSDATSETRVQSEMHARLKAELTPALCDVFMSRICRALSFLTYNVRNRSIRQRIRSIVNALQTTEPVQQVYQWHLEAHDDDYLAAMAEYYLEAKEDLVQLLYKAKDPGKRTFPLRFPGIIPIYFANPHEIPYLLSSRPIPKTRPEPLRTNTPTSIPRDAPQIQKAAVVHAEHPEEPDIKPVDEVHEEPEPQELALVTNEPTVIRKNEPTEQEISAAKKIQAVYRRYRERRKAQTLSFGKGLKAERNTAFAKCLKNVYASGWERTPYRTLYLWALPRLVVCLDRVTHHAHKFKTKTRGLLLKDHHRFEELNRQMTNINVLIKEAHDLRKTIDPDASMHQATNRDEAEMKQVVLKIKDIIHDLPVEAPEIRDDFDSAYRLVMHEEQHA